VLTVRYEQLGLRPGDRLLDLGCGGGRHAFEAARLGAHVTAADLDLGELQDVRHLFGAMSSGGELEAGGSGRAVGADALRLPFPDATFDRIIASEVMEHIPDDAAAAAELARVLRPGGTIAVTVPSWFPERVCWAITDEYHAPHVPGGHVRIYAASALRARLREAGLRPGAAHRAHALHTPYWWLKCAVGTTNDDHPLVAAWHRLLVWDITEAPPVTRLADRVLNPVLGKSLVVYATKPEEMPTVPATRPTSATLEAAR
jgi:SAM-dependent methyltransferase